MRDRERDNRNKEIISKGEREGIRRIRITKYMMSEERLRKRERK